MTSKYTNQSLDLGAWNRAEHFHFFKTFTQPFFNVHTQVDITPLYRHCQQEGLSVFLTYLYVTLKAARATENFRFRLQDGQVVVYDGLDLSTTILKQDQTIGFVSLPYQESLQEFCAQARPLIETAQHSSGLFFGHQGPDLLHLTTLPWFTLNGLEHAFSVSPENAGIPKIAFGKFERQEAKVLLPLSVSLHHALADGYHVHLFLENFNNLVENFGQ